MKIRIVIFLFALLITSSLFSQEIEPKNRLDSVSYALGVSMYAGSKQFNLELNFNMVAAGLIAAAGSNAIMEAEAANDYIRNALQQTDAGDIKKTKQIGSDFLKGNMKAEGVQVTQSGLQYKVIVQGDGPKPTQADEVKVDYEGYLLDGTKFDSSVDRGEPAIFGLGSIITGWQEALQLMPVGSEYVIWLPPHLGYGDQAMGGVIEPGSTLMFEISLLEIIKK